MAGSFTRRGQTVMPEYVVGFFLVIAAMVTLTVYVQRALQARARDAKIYMVDLASRGCAQAGDGCLQAAGARNGELNYEYEPYYTKSSAVIERTQNESKTLEVNSVFRRNAREVTQVGSNSDQRPPEDAQ